MMTQDIVLLMEFQIQARSFIVSTLKVLLLFTPSIALSLGGSFLVLP